MTAAAEREHREQVVRVAGRQQAVVEQAHDVGGDAAALGDARELAEQGLARHPGALSRRDDERADVRVRAREARRARVTVRAHQFLARRARHEQTRQHAVLDERHALRRHALVVDAVGAEKGGAWRLAGARRQQRIVDGREEGRGHLLLELRRERALLAAVVARGRRRLGRRRPSDVVGQQQLRELRAREPLEEHGARARLGDRRRPHRDELGRHGAHGLLHLGQRRQARGVERAEGHEVAQLHAVCGLRVRDDVDAHRALRVVDPRALARGQAAVHDGVRPGHARARDLRIVAEDRRQLDDDGAQRLGLDLAHGERDLEARGRLLREVAQGGVVLAGRLARGGGAFARVELERDLVRLVGAQPQLAAQRRVVVLERQRVDLGARLEVRVVEGGAADAHVGAQEAAGVRVRRRDRPEGRAHGGLLAVGQRVRDIVRAWLVAEVQLRRRAPELVVQRRAHGLGIDAHGGARRARERERREHDGGPGDPHGVASLGAVGTADAVGGGDKIGGLSLPLSRRSLSICSTSRLGLVADTGTKPDSAPQ